MKEHRHVIVHVHIFKNAGSSFDGALFSNFGKNFIDHRQDDLIRDNSSFLQEFLSENKAVKAFSSHSIFHKPRSFNEVSIHPVYMLRHPIERINSVYNFEKIQPETDSLGAKMAKVLTFEEYVAWRMQENVPATIRNLQTIFLAGANHHANHLDQKYELALETLQNSPLIGVVDRYDESMVVFEEYLREFFPNIDLSYVRKNVTDTNFEKNVHEKTQDVLYKLPDTLKTQVMKKNSFDLDLYEKANMLLDEKLKYIDNFPAKMHNFKNRLLTKNR